MVRLFKCIHTISVCRGLAASVLLLSGFISAFAQTTNIAVGSTVLQPAVKRLGINLSFQTFFDSGQMTKNLVFRNPGFEGEIFQSTIRCALGTAITCLDDDPFSAWPAGFWNGATVEFFYGLAQGRTTTVASYLPANGLTGGTFIFGGFGVAPAIGDYMIVRMTVPGNATAGWWPTTSGSGAITTNFSDLPAGTTGKQTVAVSAPAASDSATLASYFDSTAGHTFVALNGTFQLSFKAKGTGGGNSIAVYLQRAGLPTYLNQIVKLTSSWDTYNLTFNASESGAIAGTVGLKFSTVGQDSFLMDDVSLTQSNSDPSNPSVFRDAVVNALKTFQPGVIRFWANQLGDTLDNLIADPYARQRSGFSAFSTGHDDISYGLPEFLELCATVGAEPWIVVPTTFSTTEASNLIEYLAGGTSTPYGARRAAAGFSAPWTSSFSKIHLEFGNEAWNGGFKGGSIEYSAPYGQRSQTIFGAMRANGAYVSSAFDLVLGGQAAWPGRNQDIQNNCNNNDSFAVAPYMMNTVSSFSSIENLFGSTFAEPEALQSTSGTAEGIAGGLMLQNLQAIQGSNHPVPLSLYEMNLSTVSGSITQAALNNYASSLGAGLAVADSMLHQMSQGILTQNLFALQQYQFLRPDGSLVDLWGSVIDMGVTDRRRPQFLALQMANQAIGSNATMIQTAHSGANPTWDQPLVNTVQLTGAHYLQSFAFESGSSHSLIVFNLHRTSNLAVTFSDVNAPSGTVQMQQLTSGQLTDTNENSPVVNINSQTLSGFNPGSAFSLPPYSMTVLSWAGGTGAPPPPPPPQPPNAPVISALVSSGLTTTSATITWNTDQASNSQVEFGTTAAYGSRSALNTALVTAHTAVLTGLTAGTTYNFAALSANSSGLLATSGNLAFSTLAATSTAPPGAGPVISGVTSTGVTGTTATIVWFTDKASSSQVAFGTTPALGFFSAYNAAPVFSHAVTLTGLTPGTTYNFAVSSVGSSGTTTSPNSTFSTPVSSSAPAISLVTAIGITGTSATINWITDKASSSQVAYGPTTGYGSLSANNTAPVFSHSVTLTGLNPGTTYNFAVTSVGSTGTATSPNSTFSTSAGASAPVMSSVMAIGITGTSATINWITDKASSSQVAYGTTTGYGLLSAYNNAPVFSHSVTLTGLNPGTSYNFAVTSVGSTGTATSPNSTFSTPASASAPVISSVMAIGITGTSATINWITDKASSSQVAYGTTTGYGSLSAYNNAPVFSHSVTLTALNPGTTYNFAVTSVGSNGTATSSNSSFSTTASAAAPVISSVFATAITTTSATINWITDKASSSQVAYGTTTGYGSLSAYNNAPVFSHSVTLTGLNPGTTYNFAVTSVGSSGSGTSPNSAFSTTTASASGPVITGVTATGITGSTATIVWFTDKASTSQVAYGITTGYGSLSLYDTSPIFSHAVTLTGLAQGTTYNYKVSSVASTGTTSSSNFAFTTTASAASAVVISGLTSTAISASSATITWITDKASTSQVVYGPTTGYGSVSAYNSAPVFSHSVTLTGLAQGTTYNYAAISAGSTGTSTTSANLTFQTVSSGPPPPPPVNVSQVNFSGVSSSGATITWNTDQPANTVVEYGTTASLGSTSPIQTALLTSHSLNLSGLNGGTTYYFRARSTSGSNVTGYSAISSFTTLNSNPVVMTNIRVIPEGGNSAIVTLSLSRPATNQVEFGSSTSYGSWSPVTALTQTPQVSLSGVPSGLTHYRIHSTDASGSQTVSTDYTFIEP
jgi:hypothetical protein